ncbi:MAG: hypothetical protein HY287_13395 [Planctomycetes bacterium]|nr:hypothetical protein [Planctomycetota bacterium]MBI3835318.1 hypothetical protein [Planctomycetota bacterium]
MPQRKRTSVANRSSSNLPLKSRRGLRVKTPPILFEKTQEIIRRIVGRLDGTFLTYWTSEAGSICGNDVQAMYEVLRLVKPEKQIILFVKSDGGDGQSSLRLIHLLREFVGRLVVVVPLECASAATMLALGADEIQMGPLSFLTPVDTSLEHQMGPVDPRNEIAFVGQDEVQRVINLWTKYASQKDVNPYQELYKYLHPLVIGAVDRATSLSIRLCTEILRYHLTDQTEAERIANALNAQYPAHEYPITPYEARKLGLKVNALDPWLNQTLLDLNHLYSEMGQRAVTDFDEMNYHNNEIVNIIEGDGVQLYYQNDKDWHYRREERQWVTLNVESCWYQCTMKNGRMKRVKRYMS